MKKHFRLFELLGKGIAAKSMERKGLKTNRGMAGGKGNLDYRKFAMEPLENRELLAVTLAEFEAIRDSCADWTLARSMEDMNIIEVQADTLDTIDLQKVVDQATATSQDDLVVFRTSDFKNTISLEGASISVRLDSLSGSLSMVGWGSSMLQITSSRSGLLDIQSGSVQLANMTLVGLTTADNLFSTTDLLVQAEGADVVLDRVIYLTEFCNETSVYLNGETYSLTNRTDNNASISMDFPLSGTRWASVSGLSPATADNYQKLIYSENEYDVGIFYDAEKTGVGDTNLCWAAASSNALFYTGWANSSLSAPGFDFSTEDDVLAYFTDTFTDAGGNSYFAFDWFFTGNYDRQGVSGWSQIKEGKEDHGAFYPSLSIDNYRVHLHYKDEGGNMIYSASQLLKENYGVTIALNWGDVDDPSVSRGGHAITLWGYTYDTAYSVNSPYYYTGLLVSDSDDDFGGGVSAPNKCVLLSVAWNPSFSQYRFTDYSYGGGWLTEFCGLLKNPSYTWLDTPTKFAVSQGEDAGTADVVWAAVQGAKGYTLEYSTDPAFSSNVKTVTISSTSNASYSYKVSDLAYQTNYYFRVKGYSSDTLVRDSSYAGPVHLYMVAEKLSAPTGFLVTNGDSGTIQVSWNSVAKAQGYKLEYSTTSSFTVDQTLSQTYSSAPVSGESFTISGLTGNKTWYFRLKTLGDGTSSADSSWTAIQDLFVPAASATTYTVISLEDDGDGSLRQVLATAQDGSRIIFARELAGKTITLNSEITLSRNVVIDGTTRDITISGNDATRLFRVIASDIEVHFRNLLLTGGYAEGNGGAIFVEGDSYLTLTACVLSDSRATGQGGAVWTAASAVEGVAFSVTDTEFQSNTSGGSGGAIYSLNQVGISGSTFSGNVAALAGGALYVKNGLSVTQCSFINNTATTSSGGAIRLESGELYLASSQFIENEAGTDGGAVSAYASATVTNVLVAKNHAATGAGIWLRGYAGSVASFVNCTITGNTLSGPSGSGAGLYLFYNGTGLWTADVSNSIIAENGLEDAWDDIAISNVNRISVLGRYSLSAYTAWSSDSENCVVYSASPFVNPAIKNYQLKLGSPAIDAGNNSLATRGINVDLAQSKRVVNDVIDMGAFEYTRTVTDVTLSTEVPVVGSSIAAVVSPGQAAAAVSYQWYRLESAQDEGTAISGATGQSYQVVNADVGYFLKVVVTAKSPWLGAAVAVSASPAVKPQTKLQRVVLSASTPLVDVTLSTTVYPADASSLSFKWYRVNATTGEETILTGAEKSYYTPSVADIGYKIKVVVTATGSWSGTTTATSSATVALAAPSDLAVERINDTTCNVSWSAVDAAESYILEYSTSNIFINSKTMPCDWAYSPEDPLVMTELSSAQTWYFRIRSVAPDTAATGTILWSEVVTPTAVLGAPANFSVVALKNDPGQAAASIAVSWNAAFAAVKYEYQVSTDYQFSDARTTKYTTTLGGVHNVSDLNPNTLYYVRARSISADGLSSRWVSLAVTTQPIAVQFAAPTGLTAVSLSCEGVALSWNQVAGASTYRVSYSISANAADNATVLVVRGTSTTIHDLVAKNAYYFKVQAVGTGNYTDSPFSTIVKTTTTDELPKPFVTATNVTDHSVSLTCPAIKITGQNTQYQWQYKLSTVTTWTNSGEPTTDPSVTITGLTATTSYDFRVTAVVSGLKEKYSDSVSVVTPAVDATKAVLDSAVPWGESKMPTIAFSPDTEVGGSLGTFTDDLTDRQVVAGKGDDYFEVDEGGNLLLKATIPAGKYTITIAGQTGDGTSTTDFQVLVYRPNVAPNPTRVEVDSACSAQLTTTGTDEFGSPLIYTWSWIDKDGVAQTSSGSSIFISGSTLVPETITDNSYSTEVTVTAQNAFGVVSEAKTVTVEVSNVAYVKWEPITIGDLPEDGLVQKFKIDVSSVPIGKWIIHWDDNSLPTRVSASTNTMYFSHYYNRGGTYTITLELETRAGTVISNMSEKTYSVTIVKPTAAALPEETGETSAVVPVSGSSTPDVAPSLVADLLVQEVEEASLPESLVSSIAAAPVASAFDRDQIAVSLALESSLSASRRSTAPGTALQSAFRDGERSAVLNTGLDILWSSLDDDSTDQFEL